MGCIFLTGKAFQKIRRREIGNWGCHQSAQDSEPEGGCLITPPPPIFTPSTRSPGHALGAIGKSGSDQEQTCLFPFRLRGGKSRVDPEDILPLKAAFSAGVFLHPHSSQLRFRLTQKALLSVLSYTMGVPTVLFLIFIPMPPPPHIMDWVC